MVSGDGDTVPYDIHERLLMWRETLVTITAQPELVINTAIATHYPGASAPTARERSALLTEYTVPIKDAAGRAVLAFDTHIAAQCRMLSFRKLYTPRVAKPEMVHWSAGMMNRAMVGVEAHEFTAQFVTQFLLFIKEVNRLHDGNAMYATHLDTFAWLEEKRAQWPDFVRVAMFWVSWPVGNIRLERLFATMRAHGSPLRGAMLGGTMEREMEFVFHQPLLLKMMMEAVALL